MAVTEIDDGRVAEEEAPRSGGILNHTVTAYCREWARGRLPTEAEWEYAARAGAAGKPHGDRDTLTHADANYGAETCCKPHEQGDDKWKFAAPAKSLPANAYGLFDMQGNVWEWTADWYAADTYERGEESDPKGPDTGTKRVIRGGALTIRRINCA